MSLPPPWHQGWQRRCTGPGDRGTSGEASAQAARGRPVGARDSFPVRGLMGDIKASAGKMTPPGSPWDPLVGTGFEAVGGQPDGQAHRPRLHALIPQQQALGQRCVSSAFIGSLAPFPSHRQRFKAQQNPQLAVRPGTWRGAPPPRGFSSLSGLGLGGPPAGLRVRASLPAFIRRLQPRPEHYI